MKIVVIRKSGGLGDVICCEPVIRGLRKQYPHADITFIFPPEYQPLFEGRKEAMYKSLHYVRMSGRWLKKYQADNDIFVDLCGPESNDEAGGSPQCSRIESFCHYAEVEATSPRLDLTREEHKKAREALSIYPKPWVGFGINGRQWAKNWPTEHWKELATKLPGTMFYFDQNDALDLGDKVVPIVGKGLREVMGLISVLDLMITVDTGLLHTAAAVGTKTLSLWGPTDPHRTLKHYKDAYFVEPAPYREVSGCPKPCLHDPWNCGPDGKKFSRCMHAMKSDIVAGQAIEILRDKAILPETRSVSKAEYYKSKDGIPPAPEGKKRIVFAAKHLLPPIGGAERYALEMLKQLRDDGHDVVAIWSHPENSPFRHLSIEQTDGITWVQSPEGIMLNKVLAAEPDIVITQLLSAPKIARIIPKTTRLFLFLHSIGEHFCERIRSGECVDGSPINLLTCPGCDDRSFRNMRLVYQCADEVFAVSQSMADIFQKFTGREALVQYPVVDPVRCEVRGETTKEYCVAIKVTEDRGYQFLRELANSMPEEQFLWVDAPKCELPNVTVLEHKEDLKEIFGKSFLLLAPHKHFEAFGRCPAEAGWAGIPSIVSTSGGLPEAVGDGGLVLPLNSSEWVDAINKLRRDGSEWQRLSDNARRHSMAFNWDALRNAIGGTSGGTVKKILKSSVPCTPFKNDLVSVVIPTYNRVDLLPDAIDSALAQNYDNLEVIVIDDGSDDGTTEMVGKRYGKEDRVKYIWKENGNTATALNRGIKEAKGQYIQWLSDDDFFIDPDKTIKQLECFDRHPNDSLRMVYTEFESRWSGDGAPWSGEAGQVTYHKRIHPGTKENIYQAHLAECTINGSTVMFDAKLFREIGLFNSCYRYCQDYDLWLRAIRKYDTVLLKESMVARHEHKDILGKEILGTEEGRALYERNKVKVLAAARMTDPARPTICAELCLKNEEDMIEQCLDDLVQWVDHIVVFNDGSTDKTMEIVNKYPKVVDIYSQPDKGNVRTEAKDRNILLEMAKKTGDDWILFIDADEIPENKIKWQIYDLITDAEVNLYYFLEVNLWRSLDKRRVDDLWKKGWFGRLFRNFPFLSLVNEHNEHCGGIPGNIPESPVWYTGGKNRARKSDIQMKHYGFVNWNRTVERAVKRWQRDPYRIENGVERGGHVFYERMINENGMEFEDYAEEAM